MTAAATFQLFAKAPVPGTVKTRLQPALDAPDAAALYRRLVERAAEAVSGACLALPGATAELWCSPNTDHAFLRATAATHGFALRRQAAGDLGTRMRTALRAGMPGRALLLGSDCPLLDARMLVAAHRALDDDQCVFIPAEDGGYALIGCRGVVPDCFAGIAWSTGTVLAETRKRLLAAGVRWIELPPVWDVDTAAELTRLEQDARLAHLLDGLASRAGDRSRQPHRDQL